MTFESVVDQIAPWVERTPRAPAVYVDGALVCTYAQLWARAQRYAGHLVAQGVGHDDLVGIQMPREVDYLSAVLGVWCAGAAWVYLDPQWPRGRAEAVLKDGRVQLVLHGGEEGAPLAGPVPVRAEHLAYGFWTSGSTGRPKGVLVEHGGLPSMLTQQVEAFGLGPGKRALLVLRPSFDASVSDIATAWVSGAALAIDTKLQDSLLTPSALQRALTTCRATHVDLPPSLLPSLERLPDTVEAIVIGGEVPSEQAVRRWAQKVRLVSVYGPTEATVCTSMVLATSSWRSGDIGRPLVGVQYAVRDADGAPVPEGSDGELWMAGAQVARGYAAQPELTARRFVVRQGARWFRTGDRVRRRPDGGYHFLGRLDRQFKLHGQLIAPEEVEAALLEVPTVRRACVACVHDTLRAAVQPTEGATVDIAALHDHLRARLPHYLAPSSIFSVERWPLTHSGKVDESRLWSTLAPPDPVAPGDEGLLTLASEALGRAAAAHLGLVTQGADSLAMIRFVAGCEVAGLRVRLEELVADVPLEALDVGGAEEEGLRAEYLQERLRTYQPPSNRRGGERPEVWLYTGATGFLGSQVLLKHLAAQPELRAVLLVRAQDEAHARRRVQSAWAQHGGQPLEAWPPGLEIMLADLAEPRLGVSEAQYQQLLDTVGFVHHLAAQVHSLAPLETLWASNVVGTEQLLQLALDAQVRRFVFASTLSVFVGTDRGLSVALEQDDLSGSYRLFGGYAQSKWAAERAVARAGQAGLPVLQVRYGLITPGLQRGAWPQRDQLRQLLAGLCELGVMVEGRLDTDLAIDLTPVDWAAEVAVALAASADAGGAYHVSGAKVSLAQWVQALTAQGVALKAVSTQTFARQAAGTSPATRLALLSLARALGGEARHRGVDLLQATGIRFDDRRTQGVMRQLGLRSPQIDAKRLQDYVHRVMVEAA